MYFVNHTQGFGYGSDTTNGLEENTCPLSMAHALCMNGITHWKGDKLWILCTQKMSAKGEKVYVTNPSDEHNTFWTWPFHKTPNPKP